ncbi:MAG: TIGR00730 family Rossman fold protein [Bacteroidota bacterium]
MKSLSVFCGSSSGINGTFTQATELLCKVLADRNITLVYGGGSFGLMGVAASAMMKYGGKVIGVIPTLLVEKEAAKRDITTLLVVDSMQERKSKMMELSDGFLILPGGVGTLDELFEMMAFINLGVHRKPCGILNTDGFYNHLINFVDHATEQGFIRPATRRFLVHSAEPISLLQMMEQLYATQ